MEARVLDLSSQTPITGDDVLTDGHTLPALQVRSGNGPLGLPNLPSEAACSYVLDVNQISRSHPTALRVPALPGEPNPISDNPSLEMPDSASIRVVNYMYE